MRLSFESSHAMALWDFETYGISWNFLKTVQTRAVDKELADESL